MPYTSSSLCQALSKCSIDTGSLWHFSMGVEGHVCLGVWVVYILSQCLRAQPELQAVPWSSHPHPGPAHQELMAHRWAPGQLPQGRPGRPWFSLLCSHLQTPAQYRGNTYWVFTLCPGFIRSFIQFSWQNYDISIILFLIIIFCYISIFIVLLRKQTQRYQTNKKRGNLGNPGLSYTKSMSLTTWLKLSTM